MPETLSPDLHHATACSLCGAQESRTRFVVRGSMQFCQKCARGFAREARGPVGIVRGFCRRLAVTVFLSSSLAGVWWVSTHGLPDVQAKLKSIAPVLKVSMDDQEPGATVTIEAPKPAPAPSVSRAPASSWLPSLFNRESHRAVSDV